MKRQLSGAEDRGQCQKHRHQAPWPAGRLLCGRQHRADVAAASLVCAL